jgi:predicted Zn-dependent peptidase
MTQRLDKHILKNGLVILGEPMDAVASAAFEFMLPAGAAKLPAGCCGAANVIEDWIFRGAADLNSRQLGDALDGLGLHRASSIGSAHLTIGAALQADNLEQALDLYADVIQKPRLEDEQFKLAQQLAIDDLLSLDDDPRQKVMLKVKERFYPEPLGRSTAGELPDLKSLTAGQVRQIIKDRFNPAGTIFSVAGKYDFDRLCRQMGKLFDSSPLTSGSGEKSNEQRATSDERRYLHIHNDGAQVHIGLMTPIVGPADKDYYNARLALSVLSGGMSARLFTEVREKRGLCYAIGAKYNCLKEAAGLTCYAGTTPDKAQQTLDCVIGEIRRLGDSIEEDELARAKAGLKSSLILQSESSASRADALGGDYYMLGRVRSLDEIKDAIEQTSVKSVMSFLRKNKFEDFTVVTIGPAEVKVSY